jgi:hypothetical protein
MKKRLLLAASFAWSAASALFGADLGASFSLSNMYFPWASAAATGATVNSFPTDAYSFGGGTSVTTPLSENLTLTANYALSPIQRSKMSALISYSSGVLQISMGPAFGIYNDLSNPVKAGLSSSVKVTWPGVAFIYLENESSLGAALAAVGDYTQELNELRVGWYVRNAICSAGIHTEKYQYYASSTLTTTDSLVDYFFDVDIFKKNQPYNVLLSLAYRTWYKEYVDGAASTSLKDTLGSIILGTDVKLTPSPALEINLGLDSCVYTFGLDNLVSRGPSSTSYLFDARIGVVIKTDYVRDANSVNM